MSTIATALKHMLAAGMPHDAIVAAVAEMEAAVAAAQPVEKPRSKGAIRTAAWRARHKASQSVTCDDGDVTGDEKRHIDPLPCPPKDNNSNPPTHPRDNTTPRAKAEAHVAAWWAWRVKHPFPRPHWATAELWADFLACRKRKDMVNTVTAHKRLLRDMASAVARTGWPPGEIFEACVEKGWGAIYDTDEMKAAIHGNTGNRRSAGQGHSGGRDNRDGFTRALDAQIERARSGAAGRSGVGDDGGGGGRALAAPSAL